MGIKSRNKQLKQQKELNEIDELGNAKKEIAKLTNIIKTLNNHCCDVARDAMILNEQFKEYVSLKEKEVELLKKRVDTEARINFINGIIRGKSCLSEEINIILNPTDGLPF